MSQRDQTAAPERTTYPADLKKGDLQKDLSERFGRARKKVASHEPTGNATHYGASDVGEDESSGSETLEADPTRFPRDE